MQPANTRIKLTWYAVIAFTAIAFVAIFCKMEGVAAAAVGGILTVVTGYQASRAYTKKAAINSESTQSPIE